MKTFKFPTSASISISIINEATRLTLTFNSLRNNIQNFMIISSLSWQTKESWESTAGHALMREVYNYRELPFRVRTAR